MTARISRLCHPRFVAFLFLLNIASACGREAAEPRAAIRTSDPAYALYLRLICHRCHESQLQGGNKAPSLLQLPEHYDAARLLRYLEDPQAMQDSDPRLHAIDEQFANWEMPSYAGVDSAALAQLIDFLLDPFAEESR